MSLHLICADCGAQNRIPQERIADHPGCGRCHRPLFPSKPFDVGSAALDRHIAKDDVPLLLDCWAAWCGPCRAMAPQFEAAVALIAPRARLAKLDTEANPEAATRLQIRSIPTLVLFANGSEVARCSGAMDSRSLVRWVDQHLESR